ncbi:hypothetical protein I4U23_017302 [Adineta vaga]|nr:hypothetical protein I4U23_017302 [Adineta vaga]
MGWTYPAYVGCNIGISVGLILIILLVVLIIFYNSELGQKFVNERIIGIDPPELEDDEEIKKKMKEIFKDEKSFPWNILPRRCKCTRSDWIGFLFCLLGTMTLSITAILIFQGCVLANARVIPDSDCPEYPMDCFIFNETGTSSPINETVSFYCLPSNKTQFPSNLQDATGWCYGWIIRLQSTKKILDQLGVCSGLIGLFTTILAIIIYLGRTIKNLVLCSLIILSCLVTIILLPVFKWSFAPISFAVLSLGIALGAFGIFLYLILPKPKEEKVNEQNVPSDKTQTINKSDIAKPISISTNKPPQRTQFISKRTSKVNP